MKILKWIGIVIVAIVAIFLIYSASQPNKVTVEESIVIKAPADQIYNEILNFKNWAEWSVWSQMDPNMKSEFSEKMGVVGAYNAWWSENPYVGNGRQEVVELRENEYIKSKMVFEGMEDDPGYAEFILEPTEEGTKVSWTFDGSETPFYLNFMNSLIKPMLIDNYNKSLAALKEYVEAMPPAISLPENVSIEELEAQMIISILDSTTGEGISAKLTELYTELSIFLESNQGMEMKGMPLAIYHDYSPEKVIMEAAFTVKGNAESAGRVMVGELPGGMAIKGVHLGSYEGTEDMHYAMPGYAEAAGYKLAGDPWEVYANDPTMVEESEIETHIYYPVSK